MEIVSVTKNTEYVLDLEKKISWDKFTRLDFITLNIEFLYKKVIEINIIKNEFEIYGKY